jgi:hypothetical protein
VFSLPIIQPVSVHADDDDDGGAGGCGHDDNDVYP